jgi:DNA invertase Pin-like site-specific DNA recombinase
VPTPCVIYAAKSTQDKHKSIDMQLEDGREKAAEEGWVIVGEFFDENFSAYTGNRGPDLERAKQGASAAAIEYGEPCMLVVQASDRFARGSGDRPGAADALVEIWHAMRRRDVHLRSVEDDFDLRDSASVANLGHRAMMESRRKSGAVAKGNKRRVEKGLPIGSDPLGFKLVKDGYEPIPSQIATAQRIFDEMYAGVSQRRVASNLEADGVPTARGGKWTQGAIAHIARNPVYKGFVVRRGEVFPGRHEAVVDPVKWDAVNRTLDQNARSKGKGRGRPPKGKHLFWKGMLRCSCGEALIPRTTDNRHKGPYEVYLCHGRVRDTRNCSEGPFRREQIDSAVYAYFEQVTLDVEATREQLAAARSSKLVETTSYLDRARLDRRQAEERLTRVRRDYTEGRLDAEDWASFRTELNSDLEAAVAKEERLAGQVAEVEMGAELADIETETLARLAEIRKAIAGEIDQREGIEAVRAALSRAFDGFQMRRVEPGLRVHAELAWQADHILEPILKEEAIQGYSPLRPILRREPIYGAQTNSASGSRSHTTNCGPGSPRYCAAATAATTARPGSASC